MYAAREVDGGDDEIADDLACIHALTFGESAPLPDTSVGHWWLVYFMRDPMPVAFAGLTPSSLGKGVGYFKRAGVLAGHHGRGLQRRLIRVRLNRARLNGWQRVVTDTTDNPRSANNLADAGFRMFTPAHPWAFPQSLYWSKDINA